MKVPRLGVKLQLWLQAHATAIATPDLSCICNLRCSLRQHWILNSLSESRDGTYILMETSGCLNPQNHNRKSLVLILIGPTW